MKLLCRTVKGFLLCTQRQYTILNMWRGRRCVVSPCVYLVNTSSVESEMPKAVDRPSSLCLLCEFCLANKFVSTVVSCMHLLEFLCFFASFVLFFLVYVRSDIPTKEKYPIRDTKENPSPLILTPTEWSLALKNNVKIPIHIPTSYVRFGQTEIVSCVLFQSLKAAMVGLIAWTD